MSKTLAWCTMLAALVVCVVVSVAAPWMLSDSNSFLKGFVNHELLSVLTVIVTVTLASGANLHLTLNRLEEAAHADGITHPGFPGTRHVLKSTSAWLMGLLIAAIVLVVVKPSAVVQRETEVAAALFNSAALVILLASLLMLIDITTMVFAVGPRLREKGDQPRRTM